MHDECMESDLAAAGARMKWNKVALSHSPPPCVKNHTANFYRGELILFGGFDGTANNYNLHVMDIATGQWKVVKDVEGTAPAGRNGHTATLVGDQVFFIGGWLGAGPHGASDVYVLDLKWSNWHWSKLRVEGDGPGACNMHTADLIELSPTQRFIALFKGGDGRDYHNFLYLLDLVKMRWEKPSTVGTPPPVRANHSSAVFDKKLFIFGGWNGTNRLHDLYVLDMVTMTWTCPNTNGIPPSPRAGSSLTSFYGGLILFGGSGPYRTCFNDLHLFDPHSSTWYCAEQEACVSESSSSTLHSENPTQKPVLSFLGSVPEERAGHSATLIGRKIIILGGSSGQDYVKNVFELDVDPPPELTMNTLAMPNAKLVLGASSLLFSEQFSDVVFIVENERIHCHRVILSPQSEWFNAMFSKGFKETNETEIRLPSVPLQIFKLLIEYCYVGRLDILGSDLPQNCSTTELGSGEADHENIQDSEVENMPSTYAREAQEWEKNEPGSIKTDDQRILCELLELSDCLMCEHLKQHCQIALARMVTMQNVHYLHGVALQHGGSLLMEFCNHFMKWDQPFLM